MIGLDRAIDHGGMHGQPGGGEIAGDTFLFVYLVRLVFAAQEADEAAVTWRVQLAVLKDAKLDVTALSEPIHRAHDR